VVATWGSGNRLTQAQFSQMTDIRAATFAFLACFEGPQYPNFESSVTAAQQAYQIIQGQPPTPPTTNKPPIWLLFKIKWR
jgi:DNA-binding transcriptional regulator YbjK